MKARLTGVPETLLIPLWARAVEKSKPNPIVIDDKAAEMISMIDYDFSWMEKSWKSQLGVAIRTMILDNAVKKFLDQNSNAVVINLGAGLDTRYIRLNNNDVTWYDLDVPESMELRRNFIKETDKNRFIVKDMFDFSWMDEIEDKGKSVLIIAEGLFMYFEEEKLKSLFLELINRFPGAEMLFEILPPLLVGKGRMHDSIGKMDGKVEFKWGLKDSREVESWNPSLKFIEDWNLFDYRKDRWGVFGFIFSLPIIKPHCSSRIVHIKFVK